MLKKQNGHVSFLHVYHHSIMVLTGYLGTRFIPGGHASLLVIVNCFVHIFMYSYYLISAIDTSKKAFVWWKKHITHLQLVILLIYSFIFKVFFLNFFFNFRLNSLFWQFIICKHCLTKIVCIQKDYV